MSHPFHYFTPGLLAAQLLPGNILDKKLAPTVHLGHWVEPWKKPNSLSVQEVQIDGQHGAFFTPTVDGKTAVFVTYNADQSVQRWLKTPKLWIGWEVGHEPGPGELQRKTQIGGLPVEDEAGRQWIIPIARSRKGRVTTPSAIDWDLETMTPSQVRAAAYDELWELAGQVQDFWQGKEVEGHDETWIATVALKALQVNYCIGPIELNAFRAMGKIVIDQVRAMGMCLVLFDVDIVNQVDELKKNESAPALDSANS